MVDEKKLHELTRDGVIKTEDGIRVIDASKLDGPSHLRPAPVASDPRRLTPKPPTPPAPAPEAEPDEAAAEERKALLPEDLKKREALNKSFTKEFEMAEGDVPKGVGLDVGTSFLVSGRFDQKGNIMFQKVRDCFLHIPYRTPINKMMLQKGLDDRQAPYIEQPDGFYVLGDPAFAMANERHQDTRRPMSRGVLSPKEKAAFPILKELISIVVGEPRFRGERLVFGVPAKPIDAEFDQVFHSDMIKSFIASKGFDPYPMNEAEALAYSELLNEGLTGIAISCGAGMMNVVVMSAGDPVVTFSTARSGDWIDEQVAIATDMTKSLIQQEKEGAGIDLMNPDANNQIHQAIAVYYGNLLVYTLENIAHDLARSPSLPKFKDPIPMVIGGGTSLPKGFLEKFNQALATVEMPVEISQVRHASDPLHAVANGLTLAASME
jgi:hypothetical protein